jgi:hypothetical protein
MQYVVLYCMHCLNMLVLIQGTNLAGQARSTHAIRRHILTGRCETRVTLVNVFLIKFCLML